MTKCQGCGIVLQDKDKTIEGYTPLIDKPICQRCFRLKNYGEKKNESLKIDNKKIINKVNDTKLFTFFLCDFFSLNEEVVKTFKSIKNKKALLITKKDIIPKDFKTIRIDNFIRDTYSVKEDILFVSAYKQDNLTKITDYISKLNTNKIIICGLTNAGKSSFIDCIYELYNEDKSMLTISSNKNTTIDFVNVKINKYLTIVDTPGLTGYINDDRINKLINTKKYFKVRTYPIKLNEILNIENIIFMRNISKNTNSVTIYMSNELDINKIYKLDDVDSKIICVPKDSDIVIKGLGFINVKKEGSFKISGNYDLVETRKSFFRRDINEYNQSNE